MIPVAIGIMKVKFNVDSALNMNRAETKINAKAPTVVKEKRKLNQSLKFIKVEFLSLALIIAAPVTLKMAYNVEKKIPKKTFVNMNYLFRSIISSIINTGLFLLASSVLHKYSAIIPRLILVIPNPSNKIDVIAAQPVKRSSYNNFLEKI